MHFPIQQPAVGFSRFSESRSFDLTTHEDPHVGLRPDVSIFFDIVCISRPTLAARLGHKSKKKGTRHTLKIIIFCSRGKSLRFYGKKSRTEIFRFFEPFLYSYISFPMAVCRWESFLLIFLRVKISDIKWIVGFVLIFVQSSSCFKKMYYFFDNLQLNLARASFKCNHKHARFIIF